MNEGALRELALRWLAEARAEHERGNDLDSPHTRDSQNYAYGCEHTLERCAAELIEVAIIPKRHNGGS